MWVCLYLSSLEFSEFLRFINYIFFQHFFKHYYFLFSFLYPILIDKIFYFVSLFYILDKFHSTIFIFPLCLSSPTSKFSKACKFLNSDIVFPFSKFPVTVYNFYFSVEIIHQFDYYDQIFL